MRKLAGIRFVVASILVAGITLQSGPRTFAGSFSAEITRAPIAGSIYTGEQFQRWTECHDPGVCGLNMVINMVLFGTPSTVSALGASLAGNTHSTQLSLDATADSLAANDKLDELRQVVAVAQPDAKEVLASVALESKPGFSPLLNEAIAGIRKWAATYASDEFKHAVAQLSDQDLVVSIALSN